MGLAYAVYTLLLFLMLLFTIPVAASRRGEVYSPVNRFSYFFPIFILAIIFGFRYGVGVDYFAYEDLYTSQRFHSIFDGSSNELLFGGIYYGCFKMGLPYAYVQVILNFIFFFFFYKSFEGRKDIMPWAVLFFFLTGTLFLYLNIQRQGIALSILIYSVQYIEKRKLGNFLLYILIAMGFHLSAILFLPMYFLWRLMPVFKLRKTQLIIWGVTLLFSVILLNVMTELSMSLLTGTKYGRYGELVLNWESDKGSGMGTMVKGLCDLFAIFYSRRLFHSGKYQPYFDIVYFIFFIGSVLSNIFQYNLLLNRVAFLFVSFRFIVLACVYDYIFHGGKILDKVVAVGLLFVCFAYFLGMIYIGNNECSPFQFISWNR